MTQDQYVQVTQNALLYGMGVALFQTDKGGMEVIIVPPEDYRALAEALNWSVDNMVKIKEKKNDADSTN